MAAAVNSSGIETANESSYILDAAGRRHQFTDDRGSSIDSAENAFDDMKQLINDGGDEPEQTSSLPYASFNYINSVLGSGVIGIPYALHEAGFGLGLILLFVVAYLTDYSLVLMVRSGHLAGKFSYQGIMETAFGRPGYYILTALQFIYPFVAMVSYNVVVGDTLTKVIVRIFSCDPGNILARREVVVFLVTVTVTVPLCLYREVSRLAKISAVSLVCLFFILVSIFIRMGEMKHVIPASEYSWKFANWDLIPAIGIMAFAFMCHHNTFLIYGSIKETSQEKWDTVTHISIFTSTVVALLFGVVGYATFAAYSQGDLLENYCWDDDLMNFCRVLFCIEILLTYPIECFVARDVIETSVFKKDANVPMSENTHYLITLSLVGSTYLISIATDCLGVVLELNGVLAAVPLAYLLPAAIYLRLEEGPIMCRKKIPSIILVTFGVTVATMGTLFLFFDFDEIDTCSHGRAMFYCNSTGVNDTFSLPVAM